MPKCCVLIRLLVNITIKNTLKFLVCGSISLTKNHKLDYLYLIYVINICNFVKFLKALFLKTNLHESDKKNDTNWLCVPW